MGMKQTFHVIPMPYNAEGQAPEMDRSKVVRTVWEVWDEECITISEHETKEEAEKAREDLWA